MSSLFHWHDNNVDIWWIGDHDNRDDDHDDEDDGDDGDDVEQQAETDIIITYTMMNDNDDSGD